MLFAAVALACVTVFPVAYVTLERGSVEAQAGEALLTAVTGPASVDPGLPPVIRVDLAVLRTGDTDAYGYYPTLASYIKDAGIVPGDGVQRFESDGMILFYAVEGTPNPQVADHRVSSALVVDVTPQLSVIGHTAVALFGLSFVAAGCIAVLGCRLARSSRDHERRLSEFFANASHELKTPIAVIDGYREAMAAGVVDPSDGLPVVERATDSMRRQVEDILALSRADAGALRPVMEPVDARELVCDVLEDLDMVADGEGVSVSLDDPGTLRGETDERMLTAMVSNLVTNAIRHASARVWVSVVAEESTLRVMVANDGEILSPESAARAFDRFYRGEGGSCGLGLPVAAAYATALGGEVSLGVEGDQTVANLYIPFIKC
ncbi:HAMP domain-containing sensor histidine kinase [Atopobiaceae bacterium 24-176]